MRGLVAFVLAHALVVISTIAPPLHVHQYVGHDHPDHHHAPATHEHQGHSTPAEHDHRSPTEDHEPALQAQTCDPGRHAVSVGVRCACMPPVHVDAAKLPEPILAAPIVSIGSVKPLAEVRAHGPPFDARIPSRAPPEPTHA